MSFSVPINEYIIELSVFNKIIHFKCTTIHYAINMHSCSKIRDFFYNGGTACNLGQLVILDTMV